MQNSTLRLRLAIAGANVQPCPSIIQNIEYTITHSSSNQWDERHLSLSVCVCRRYIITHTSHIVSLRLRQMATVQLGIILYCYYCVLSSIITITAGLSDTCRPYNLCILSTRSNVLRFLRDISGGDQNRLSHQVFVHLVGAPLSAKAFIGVRLLSDTNLACRCLFLSVNKSPLKLTFEHFAFRISCLCLLLFLPLRNSARRVVIV